MTAFDTALVAALRLKEEGVMKLKLLLFAGLFTLSAPVLSEGGCPQGQTPRQMGAVTGCVPGGNDPPVQGGYPQSSAEQYSYRPPQATGWWEKTWGAIAPSPKGAVLGTAVGAASKEEAEQLALADCIAKGGPECEVRLVYRNQCAAMVVGDEWLQMNGAESIEIASDLALKECRERGGNCRVYYSACTEPIFHPY